MNPCNRVKKAPDSWLLWLSLSGAVMLAGLWMLVSMALNPRLSIVFNARGATAGIALLWFLTSGYIPPWYLALGVSVAVITGHHRSPVGRKRRLHPVANTALIRVSE